MSARCPCGLRPEWAAPEAHDNPACPDYPDRRRLRVVQPDERNHTPAAPSVTQIADMPGAYAVRRVTGPAEALINRGRTGDWFVMFGHDPAAGEWSSSAVLPGRYGDAEAAIAAVQLADAHTLGVPWWPDYLARAAMTGEPVLALARLHAPFLMVEGDPSSAVCLGEGDIAGSIPWPDCPTVKILAASLGLDQLGR